LFVSAYPSFFICTFYVLVAALLSFIIKGFAQKRSLPVKPLVNSQALTALMFVAFSAPAIISYASILPYYQRGAGVALAGALQNNFHPTCIISFLFPSVPIKNPASYSTDLISRNIYFNVLLLVFASCIFFLKKTFRDKFTLAGILFFFLFSLGDVVPLRSLCYQLLPLMDTFRHPSNARLFVIIGAIVLGITVYHRFTSGEVEKNYLFGICLVLTIFIIARLTKSLSEVNLVSKISLALSSDTDTRDSLKLFFQTLTSNDHLVVNGVAQLIFLTLFIIFIWYKKIYFLTILILLNSFLLAQFTIPYTLVSKITPAVINNVLEQVPVGYPKPDKTKALSSNQITHALARSPVVMDEFYNKMIAAPDLVVTPTFINNMQKLYADTVTKDKIFSQPYAYFDSANSWFELDKIWNNGFSFTATTQVASPLRLQQVYLPGWKCLIDGKHTDISTYGPGFMSAIIPPGKHIILFKYQPAGIVGAVLVSLISLLGCFILSYKKL
jgi:TM2 domain-containing membrane protein YozV